MTTSKKYYWIKLSEDFFHDKAIKKLRRLAGGDTYTIIYLKMLLRSTSSNGLLYYEGIEETFADEIALDIDEDPENVKVTINYLIRTGLLTEKSESEAVLEQLPEMVGSETSEAQKKRRQRSKKVQGLITGGHCPDTGGHCPDTGGHCPDTGGHCPPEIEIEKEIEKEIETDKEVEIETESCTEQSKPAPVQADVDAVVLNDGSEWRPDIDLYHEYQRLYPAVDIDGEFRKMRAWCVGNPKKRKTRSGVKRFVASWLGRAQDAYHPTKTGSGSSSYIDAIKNRVDVVDTWT